MCVAGIVADLVRFYDAMATRLVGTAISITVEVETHHGSRYVESLFDG